MIFTFILKFGLPSRFITLFCHTWLSLTNIEQTKFSYTQQGSNIALSGQPNIKGFEMKSTTTTTKTIQILALSSGLTLFSLFQGCTTPKTAGLDSAYLNKNRGAPDAQISRAEARQYRRQQALSADEVRLENMKRRQTTDSMHENASAVSHTASATRNVRNLLRGW